ncbi:MAG: hypothetical protein IPN65_05795 [Elusimicrobia bacterium]|jgi:uncharacterized membrane protein YdfJ with MMPL/SSD domain|nr:hypothetical protein [Elusimicrobiota bacterium]MBK8125651.1 hypothetical protein [Elusimicrobiota bacterium]MBK9429995.1 hypothetical protein [Elusimicrobiota bacterium]
MFQNKKHHEIVGMVYRGWGWATLLSGGMMVAIAGCLLFFMRLKDFQDVSPILIGASCLLANTALMFPLGKALSAHKEWGRKVGGGLAALMLIGFPVGTVLGGWMLWGLIKKWDE